MTATMDHTATFRQEAAELMTQLEGALLDMEERPDDRGLVDSAFRALHTLKGSGGMFGFDALAAFTHHIENAFDRVRSGDLAVSKELVNLTLAAMDHIHVLVEAPKEADQVRGDTLIASFREIVGGTRTRGARSAAPPGSAVTPPPDASRPDDSLRTWRIRFRPGPDILTFGTNLLALLNELRELGTCTVVPLTCGIPALEDLSPTACHLAWDILLTTAAPKTAIDDVFIFVNDLSEIAIEPVPVDPEAPEAMRIGEILVARGDVAADAVVEALQHQNRLGALLVAEGKVSGDRVQSALVEQRHVRETSKVRPTPTAAASIRVPAERLDNLMDQVGELVIAHARLAQLAATGSDSVLQSISEEIGRLASELRDTTMGIRMLPIGTLFGKFRRVVHDLSNELGKSVELTMAGEETELDKTVIECLNDPLVHLIRNAIDHGIETAADRKASGKLDNARVHLAAVHSGAQVLITISDNGRGMNRAAIRTKAEEKGLLAPGQDVSDAELFGMVFQPGFSTAAVVTNVSGRGVGMDVVKRTIDGLRGTIDVASTEGNGSTITLKLPLTLAIIDGLLVRVARGRYVIPLSAVEECVELTREQDMRSGGRNFLNIRGEIVPFLRLREVFGTQGPQDEIQKVAIVSAGDVRVGLVVDQVIGQYQTVIKSLSKLHNDVEGFSGATILGDGTVALILDIPRLIGFAQEREMTLKAG